MCVCVCVCYVCMLRMCVWCVLCLYVHTYVVWYNKFIAPNRVIHTVSLYEETVHTTLRTKYISFPRTKKYVQYDLVWYDAV